MKKKFGKEFDEEEEFDSIDEPEYCNTVEISHEDISKETSEMFKNEIKLKKLKIKALRKEKKEIKKFQKQNPSNEKRGGKING